MICDQPTHSTLYILLRQIYIHVVFATLLLVGSWDDKYKSATRKSDIGSLQDINFKIHRIQWNYPNKQVVLENVKTLPNTRLGYNRILLAIRKVIRRAN
jgi:hypothetical protein